MTENLGISPPTEWKLEDLADQGTRRWPKKVSFLSGTNYITYPSKIQLPALPVVYSGETV